MEAAWWIIIGGGIAAAIGLTMTLMALDERPLTPGELLGILIASVSLAVAIYIATRQESQIAKVDKIIRTAKYREDKRKKYFLTRIRSYTQLIRDKFEFPMNLIEKFQNEHDDTITESGMRDWNRIVEYCKGSIQEIDGLGLVAHDFDRIYDLIENQYLSDKYYDVTVYLSKFTLGQVAAGNPYVHELSHLKEMVKKHMAQLDKILESIDGEMPKDEK